MRVNKSKFDKKLVFGKRFEFNNEFFDEPLKLGFIDLYQIGELYCEAGFQIKAHAQSVYEISFIVSGEGTFITDGVETHVRENNVYLNSIGHVHAIRADKGSPLRFFYLAFDFGEDGMRDEFEELRAFYKTISQPLMKDKKNLAAPFNNIFYELYNKDQYSLEMVESYILQVIILTYRSYKECNKPANIPLHNDNTVGPAVYSLIRYIDENFLDITESKFISNDLGYSYTYLAHVFKKKMGMSITTYIIQKKMEEAKQLLSSGRFNITQTAMKLNYMSVQSFSSSFKKFVGVSPADYVKMNQDYNIKDEESSL